MIREGKIGESEAIALIVTVISVKVFLSYPSLAVSSGGSATWLVVLISCLFTSLMFWFIQKLLQRFPGLTFTEIVEQIAGPFFGSFIVLLVLTLWLYMIALNLRGFAELVIVVALPETPISLIMIIFVIITIIISYLGIQTIARASFLAFPYLLGSVVLMITLTYSLWRTDWLFPLLGNGVIQTLKQGIFQSSFLFEITAIYLLPFLFYSQQIKRIGYKSIGLVTFIFFITVLSYTLSFPAVVGQEPFIPLYVMARSVYLGRFLQRIEAIFVIFWVVSAYIWISFGLYGFCRFLADFFKLPDYRPLILPGAIIIFALAFIPASLHDTILAISKVRDLAIIGFFGIPFLLLILAVIRGKGVSTSGTRQS